MAQPPPAVRGPPRHQEKNLGYLIVIYIGNQTRDTYAIRYDTSMGYWIYTTQFLLHILFLEENLVFKMRPFPVLPAFTISDTL